MSLLKNFLTFSIFTLISRILGFIRDMLIASQLGTTAFADVFFVAFRVPNVFRSLFAEGAFSSAFIPIYSQIRDKDFVNKMFTILAITLIVFCVIMQIIMPFFIYIIAPSFLHTSNKFDITVLLSRIMFPYLITISLVSLLSGVLQAKKRFAVTAAAPIILNISMIFGISYLTQYVHVIYSLAFSVIIAGLLQLLLLLIAVAHSGNAVKLGKLDFDENVKKFFRTLIPVVFGAGIIQVSTLIDTFFASTIPGGVSYLYYADRLTQLPLALIGISLGTVLLPVLSNYASKSDTQGIIDVQNKAIRLGLILCIPSATALYTLAETAVTCLFAYGEFSLEAIEKTTSAVKAFATALPAFVLYKILINNYFARGDTKTPVIFSSLCLLVNVLLNFILLRYYGHVGIVIATSVSNWLNVFLLTTKLRLNKFFLLDKKLDTIMLKILISTGFMMFVTQLLDSFLKPLILGTLTLKLFVIICLTIIGSITYFSSLYLIGKIKFFAE